MESVKHHNTVRKAQRNAERVKKDRLLLTWVGVKNGSLEEVALVQGFLEGGKLKLKGWKAWGLFKITHEIEGVQTYIPSVV